MIITVQRGASRLRVLFPTRHDLEAADLAAPASLYLFLVVRASLPPHSSFPRIRHVVACQRWVNGTEPLSVRRRR